MSRKYRMFLILTFCVFVLGACKSEDKIVVNLSSTDEDSNGDISSGKLVYEGIRDWKDEEYTTYEDLQCDSSTKYINFVDTKYTKFWNLISNNALDAYYNQDKIKKGSFSEYIDKNDSYYVDWFEETQYSYANLLQNTKIPNQYVTNQNNYYFAYLNDIDSLYSKLFKLGQGETPIVSKSVREKLSYSLLDKVREYTVNIKEYEFLLTKNVYFEHVDGYNGQEKLNITNSNATNSNKDNSKKVSFVSGDIEFNYIKNDAFCDIVKDYYYDVINKYSNVNIDDKESLELAKKYNEYWLSQYEKYYYLLSKQLDDDGKKILDKVLSDWRNYVNSAGVLQSYVLENSSIFKSSYGNNIKVDTIVYKAEEYRKQTIEILEWIYLINGEIPIN